MLSLGTAYTTAVPIIGTMHAATVTRQRRFAHFAPAYENTNAEMVLMTPVGMLSKDASTDENPRLAMMMLLNVVSPPFGMLMAMLKKKMIPAKTLDQ